MNTHMSLLDDSFAAGMTGGEIHDSIAPAHRVVLVTRAMAVCVTRRAQIRNAMRSTMEKIKMNLTSFQKL